MRECWPSTLASGEGGGSRRSILVRARLASQGGRAGHLGDRSLPDRLRDSSSLAAVSPLLARCVACAEREDKIYHVDVGGPIEGGHPHSVRGCEGPSPLSFWVANGSRYHAKWRRCIAHGYGDLGTGDFPAHHLPHDARRRTCDGKCHELALIAEYRCSFFFFFVDLSSFPCDLTTSASKYLAHDPHGIFSWPSLERRKSHHRVISCLLQREGMSRGSAHARRPSRF